MQRMVAPRANSSKTQPDITYRRTAPGGSGDELAYGSTLAALLARVRQRSLLTRQRHNRQDTETCTNWRHATNWRSLHDILKQLARCR